MSEANLTEDAAREQVPPCDWRDAHRTEVGVAYLHPTTPLTDADYAAIAGKLVTIRLLENDYAEDWRAERIEREARDAARYGIRALRAAGRWA